MNPENAELIGHILTIATFVCLWIVAIIVLDKAKRKMEAQAKKELKEELGLPVQNSNQCPPHKWEYDHTGRMFCGGKCKKRPGMLDTQKLL